MYGFKNQNWPRLLTILGFIVTFCDAANEAQDFDTKNVRRKLLTSVERLEKKIKNMNRGEDKPTKYKLTIKSSSPSVLDSIIDFQASLQAQGKDVSNTTLFVYSWMNSANEHLLSTEANYESFIEEKSFYSSHIDPSIYTMEVKVHTKERRREVASGAITFNLTEFLNGRLDINQHLTYKKDKLIFATNKPINLSSVMTDRFEYPYTHNYIWYVNQTFIGWDEIPNFTYPGGNISGSLNITVRVKAFSSDLLLFKRGGFTRIIELKDAINITNVTGIGQVHEGQPLTVNVSYNGSNPTKLCWNLSNVNFTTMLNCSTVYIGQMYTIVLPSNYTLYEGKYQLNITVQNDVSRVNTQTSFDVIDNTGHKPRKRIIAVTVTFSVVGLLITILALAYAARPRKRSHPTEVADFNFHPQIKTRSKLSVIAKNLVNMFAEREEFDGRQHFAARTIYSRSKSYGAIKERADSNEESQLSKTII